jgi:hypothetical protein
VTAGPGVLGADRTLVRARVGSGASAGAPPRDRIAAELEAYNSTSFAGATPSARAWVTEVLYLVRGESDRDESRREQHAA